MIRIVVSLATAAMISLGAGQAQAFAPVFPGGASASEVSEMVQPAGHSHHYPRYRGSSFCGGYGSLPIDCFRGDYGYGYGYGFRYGYWPRYSSAGSRHVRWCRAHYRSYNARTNTYTGKSGRKYRCNSP